jgi:hypothetical protein
VYGFALKKSYRHDGVATIQAFGSLMLWNPHIHMIVTEGAFGEARRFHPMPEIPTELFFKVWEHHVFEMLIEKNRIKPELANDMRQWVHTGSDLVCRGLISLKFAF